MIKSNYEVEILVNGHPVREYLHEGRYFIEARDGNTFSIKIKNNGYRRILAVPTVDGLSVMNGKEATFKSGGYIVNGYSSITIDGWRVSNDEVRKFFFTNPSNSYAKRKGKGGNVGVIGVAVFREKETIIHYQNQVYGSGGSCGGQSNSVGAGWSPQSAINILSCSTTTGSNFSGQSVRSVSQDVGTGFGESKTSQVVTTSFEEESSPDTVFELFYNSRKQLESMGVTFENVQYMVPRAFPNEFCEEPPTN